MGIRLSKMRTQTGAEAARGGTANGVCDFNVIRLKGTGFPDRLTQLA